MNPANPYLFAMIAAALFSGLACPALALSSDKSQPIYVHSDSAESNKSTGVTIYRGNVEVQQGTLQIHADQVTIHSENNQVSRVIAQGAPAQYQQQPSPEKAVVTARASTINYRITEEKLELLSNASLTQDGTQLTGNTIHYDIKASSVKASGGQMSDDGRIHMVIPAKSDTPQ